MLLVTRSQQAQQHSGSTATTATGVASGATPLPVEAGPESWVHALPPRSGSSGPYDSYSGRREGTSSSRQGPALSPAELDAMVSDWVIRPDGGWGCRGMQYACKASLYGLHRAGTCKRPAASRDHLLLARTSLPLPAAVYPCRL